MSRKPPDHIIERLRSGETEAAWAEFLEEYASLMLQVVRHFEPDGDRAADCFQFVCERLVEGRFRRLRRFDSDGAATFPTWLRAVVRNLCLDRRRKEFGRPRTFRSISRLSALDQEIFRRVYEQGNSAEEAFLSLAPRFPDLTRKRVAEGVERLGRELTTTQRWLLSTRKTSAPGQAGGEFEEADVSRAAPDPRPDPEAQTLVQEQRAALGRALARLPKRERLLIRMRFEEELTLDQIARLLDLGNAQRVDRQIKDVLRRLRGEMNSGQVLIGPEKARGRP